MLANGRPMTRGSHRKEQTHADPHGIEGSSPSLPYFDKAFEFLKNMEENFKSDHPRFPKVEGSSSRSAPDAPASSKQGCLHNATGLSLLQQGEPVNIIDDLIMPSLTKYIEDHRGGEPTKLVMTDMFFSLLRWRYKGELKYISSSKQYSLAGYPIEVIRACYDIDNIPRDFHFKWVKVVDPGRYV